MSDEETYLYGKPGTDYTRCIGELGEKCLVHGASIRKNGTCKRAGDGVELQGQPCCTCGTHVPDHLGQRYNPAIYGDSAEAVLSQIGEQEIYEELLELRKKTHFCDACADDINSHCIPRDDKPGMVLVKGKPTTLFVNAKELQKLHQATKDEERKRVEIIVEAFLAGKKIRTRPAERMADGTLINWCSCGCGGSGTSKEMFGLVYGIFAAPFTRECLEMVRSVKFTYYRFNDALARAKRIKRERRSSSRTGSHRGQQDRSNRSNGRNRPDRRNRNNGARRRSDGWR